MGVVCQILINRPRDGVHRAGTSVKGTLKYVIDEPTEYKDVMLSFFGKGKCQWTERQGKNNVCYSGSEKYVVDQVSICNKKTAEATTLHGEYHFSFEFYLPEHIPCSFKDQIGSITYEIEAKFVKPSFFSFNKVFTSEIPVHNYVTPNALEPVVFGLDKKLVSLFAAKPPIVNLKAEIDKTCLRPGENAKISYTVNNNTNVKINSVKAEIYCYITYTADGGKTQETCNKVKGCEVETTSISEGSTFEYSCILPTLPELYSIDNCRVIKKEYRVRVTVQLPMPHRNASVEMPVLIGALKENVDTDVEAVDGGEEPPSYWEAMCEGKEEKSDT